VSRILVINDDAFAGLGVQTLLAGRFHDAVLVQDTAGGILELASSRFDLVILDILQARMDGLALIARLCGFEPALPVICMTVVKLSELTRPNLDFSELATEAGATCCLRRPMEPRQLLEAVNSSLGLSNNNDIASMHRELSAEFSFNPKIAIIERTSAPRELRNALAVLRQYVQEPGHESGADPHSLGSVHEMAARALGADGVSNKAGGFRLSISVRTFEAHRANVMGKLGAKNAAELVRFGLEGGR
jgi:DNA-binding NarL/FixJ family response regulator